MEDFLLVQHDLEYSNAENKNELNGKYSTFMYQLMLLASFLKIRFTERILPFFPAEICAYLFEHTLVTAHYGCSVL